MFGFCFFFFNISTFYRSLYTRRKTDGDPVVHQPRDLEGWPGPRQTRRRHLSPGASHLPLSASVDLVAGSPLRCLSQSPASLPRLSSLRVTRQQGSVESKGISKWPKVHIPPPGCHSYSSMYKAGKLYLPHTVTKRKHCIQGTWHLLASEQLVFLPPFSERMLYVALAFKAPGKVAVAECVG